MQSYSLHICANYEWLIEKGLLCTYYDQIMIFLFMCLLWSNYNFLIMIKLFLIFAAYKWFSLLLIEKWLLCTYYDLIMIFFFMYFIIYMQCMSDFLCFLKRNGCYVHIMIKLWFSFLCTYYDQIQKFLIWS